MSQRNGRIDRARVAISALCAVLAVILVILGYRLGAFRWVDNYFFDHHFKWRGPLETSGEVVLVLMDQKSAAALGREKASWSRHQMALALDHLREAGAEIIGLDMIFMAPDPDPSADRELAAAMDRCNNVVLARGTSTQWGELEAISTFQEMAIGDGFINFLLDEDEVLRRVRYLHAKPLPDGHLELLPSFSLELARTYLNVDFNFDFSDDDHLVIGSEGGPQLRIPYPELIINYHGDYQVFPHISYVDAVQNSFPPEKVNDRLVIIGSSLSTEKDIFSTPYTRFLEPSGEYEAVFGSVVRDVLSAKDIGVACHAHAVETILSQQFIQKLPSAYVMALIGCLAIIGTIFYLPRIGIIGATVFLIGSLGLIVGAGHLAFLQSRIWVPIAPLMAILSLQYLSGVIVQKIFEQRRASFVTSLFGKFVSYSVVDELIRGNLELDLAGRHQELTMLFSDIRGFTTISERLGAKETGELLNHYFSKMVPIVFKHQGTLDKLIGDAIMAFFGAPIHYEDHPIKAAETAVHMLDSLKKMQREAAVEGISDLRIGIGLNTGLVTVGNLGSSDFMDYTVIGDAVNLASRLEGLNKIYGTKILLSEFTADQLDDRFLLRELDRVKVKGKETAVTIYELMGYTDAMGTDAGALVECFHSGLAAYRSRQWETAARRFNEVLQKKPADGPSLLYLERLKACCEMAEDAEWDSVTAFTKK